MSRDFIPARILLIDDDEEAYLVCRAHLEYSSPGAYAVDWAKSYETGLASAIKNEHDLYVVDVLLGDGPTGIDLIERARMAGNNSPMIVLTGHANPAQDRRSMVAGGTDYLEKSEVTSVWFERSIRYALERSRSERWLRESELRYRSLFRNNPHLVFGLDLDGKFVVANPALVRLLGTIETALLGTPFRDVVAPQHVREAAGVLSTTMALGAQRFELCLRRRDGREVMIEGRSVPVQTENDRVRVYVFAEDVDERRRSQERIRFQAKLLDAVGQAVIAVDPSDAILYWNHAAASLYGWTSGEVLGRPLGEILSPGFSPLGDLVATVQRGPGATWSGELRVKRRDGTEFPAYVTNSLIHDARGNLVARVGISIDLTERKSLETQLLLSTKLEAVGRLAGGVAHDFNNLLTSILGFSQLALEELSDRPAVASHIAEALRSAHRAQDLTRQLLAFGRKQLLQPRVINLGDTIEEMGRMLGRTLGEDIQLVLDAQLEPGWVRVDPGQAEQVILNLALNARDAMPKGGRLSLSTECTVLDQRDARRFGFSVVPGEYVCLTVSDTGVGMEPEVLSQIFEPFFSTKQTSGGTGLGLAVAFGIVKQSGGYIWALSQPGQGSTFRVYFPRCAKPATADISSREPILVPSGDGRVVLVVEDEGSVRAMVRKVLHRGGYDVIDAAGGEEALRHAREARERLSLILTDVVMPGMSGCEVVEKLAKEGIRPRVIYMSGYARDEMKRWGLSDGTYAFLQKPFLPDELLAFVADQWS